MCAKRKAPYGKSKIHIPTVDQAEIQVLYIHPAKQGVDFRVGENMGRAYGLIPVGLPAIINLLKQNGIAVRGINYSLERQVNPAFDIKHWLKQYEAAQIILIDLHWYEHSYGAIQAARLCKEVLPYAYMVLGGLSATCFSSQILEQFPAVDFVIRGDAEKPLLALAQHILQAGVASSLTDIPNLSYRRGEAIIENACTYCANTADLDSLDFADISFMDHYRDYYIHEYIVTDIEAAHQALKSKPFWGKWICTARGCKYECSYCGGCKSAHKTLANRDGIVTRSPRAVVDEIQKLQKADVIQASLSYDIAELGDEYWQEFFALLGSSGVKIGLYNEFFQLPEPQFIQEFGRRAHMPYSCVALSPLSGSERVRRLNGKLFSNEQLLDTLELLNQVKANIFVYFSLNLPGETEATFNETVDLANLIYDFYPPSRLKILNTIHTIDPLSPMNLYPEKFGIESSMSTFMDYYSYCEQTQLALPEAKTEKLRGFKLAEPEKRVLERMVQTWARYRTGKENSWWPVPPSW
jgi:radical SAM superfamily enzyme YgiQ (UPF0313 family)